MTRIQAAAVAAILSLAPMAVAQAPPGVYVILDGSGSMWGQLPDGTHKITAAREVVGRFAADDYAGRELAFRVYGHRREGDCADSELVVPFSDPAAAISRMSDFAEGVNPKGKTPIARSLRLALEDFGDRPGEIILVSDGIETCDEDPCELVRQWRESNVEIRVHVVGLGLEEKERQAMACISDAAGTTYYDAQSADDLAAGLAEIQQGAGEPGEPMPSHWQVLDIDAVNAAGESMRVHGTAQVEGLDPIPVSSLSRNRVPPGEHTITVGVRTRNGNLYRPVTRSVTVAESGLSSVDVVVPEPPSVRAKFIDRGEEVGGSLVRGYQDGEEVLRFRPQDLAYVDPGTYEFRAAPNPENELAVTETLADGDHAELLFELVQTVRAHFTVVPAGTTDTSFRTNYELWQDGERVYKVHSRNGVLALPGTYDLHLPLRLTPYVHRGVVLTTEPEQEFTIEVPVGWATIRYLNADGSPGPESRIFVQRRTDEGRWVRDGIFTAGDRIPLVPGSYKVEGWGQLGDYDDVHFEIAVGDEKELTLRDQGE